VWKTHLSNFTERSVRIDYILLHSATMPRSKIDENQLLDRLTNVFRLYGYEGTSLTRLTAATGLQRASLYHHFPGGKDQMAVAVLERVAQRFMTDILKPLTEPGEPAQRIQIMAERLSEFYEAGNLSCLLDTLSVGERSSPLHDRLKRSMSAWLAAMAGVAREVGLSAATAQRQAETALMEIEGALVLARVTGDTAPFQRVLQELPLLLTLAE
jgi:AcrR family transcriptional regulator